MKKINRRAPTAMRVGTKTRGVPTGRVTPHEPIWTIEVVRVCGRTYLLAGTEGARVRIRCRDPLGLAAEIVRSELDVARAQSEHVARPLFVDES